MSDQPQQPAQMLTIEKIYVKDCSIEVPGAPQVFFENLEPQIEVQLQTATAGVGDGLFECVLTITVTAKAAERSLFLVEAAQSGIFQIRGFEQQELDVILGIGCPTSLFPYARETISSLVNRAGFPPINLAPISFEALYAQRLQQQQGASGSVQQ